MSLENYLEQVYDNNERWFVDEVNHESNQKRIHEILEIKKYLSGKHKISGRVVEKYNGKPYKQRRVILQYGKLLLNNEVSFLLKNPISIIGSPEITEPMQEVYKSGNYHGINYKVLSDLVKYGNAYEYVYDDDGTVTSKVIDASSAYPIYDAEMNMVAFIEYYMALETETYIVYTEDKVYKYMQKEKDVVLDGFYNNSSGLPIHYKTDNELNNNFGISDLNDYVNIIDNMEDLISKFSDSYYKYMDPIPVVSGQQLKGQGIDENVVGGGLTLDDGSTFNFESGEMDSQAFKTLYDNLLQTLLNVSMSPAVSLNSTDVSNLSEVSMKILYQLASVKGGINEQYLREGIRKRHQLIMSMLDIVDADNSLDIQFRYDRPVNNQDVTEDLVKLYEVDAISIETLVELSPYINNEALELERLENRKGQMEEEVE